MSLETACWLRIGYVWATLVLAVCPAAHGQVNTSRTSAEPSAGPSEIRIGLTDLLARALEKNPDIAVQRENVTIADEAIRRGRGAYDTVVRLDTRARTHTDPVNSFFSGAPEGALAPRTTTFGGSASISRLFENGATLSGSTGVSRETTNGLFNLLSPSWITSASADYRYPLWQGRQIDAPRRALRVAAVERTRSELAMQRTVSETVAAVERAYWTLVAARRDIAVRERAIALATRQREDTQSRIDAGVTPESDLAPPTAEIARRRGELYAAQENVRRAEHALKLLVLASPDDPLWNATLAPADDPATDAHGPSLTAALDHALAHRPEIGEAAQTLARLDVELDAARDRLKPALDVVASYALRGLAGAENADLRPPFPIGTLAIDNDLTGSLFQSWANAFTHRFTDIGVGVTVAMPIGNRAARADVATVEAQRRQAQLAVDQVRARISAEVRNAIAALETATQRIDAARAGREAALTQLQAEQDRFEAGLTTSFFVLTRQNDLAQAELAETAALSDYRKALSELARASGTLIADRGIAVR